MILLITGILAGFSLGLVLARFLDSRQYVAIIRDLTVARSTDPVKTAEALGHLDTVQVLNRAPPQPDPVPEQPAKGVKEVMIDGTNFEFPADSPLTKMWG